MIKSLNSERAHSLGAEKLIFSEVKVLSKPNGLEYILFRKQIYNKYTNKQNKFRLCIKCLFS